MPEQAEEQRTNDLSHLRSGPMTLPEGIVVEWIGRKLHIYRPKGMPLVEALARVQHYMDRANAATGLDIKMLLPSEQPQTASHE